MAAKLPTAAEIRTWTTSRLLACYVQVCVDTSVRSQLGPLRGLYASEIDRRFPVGAGS